MTNNKSEYYWRPISTVPKDNPNLLITLFADYTDEPKSYTSGTVAELEIFKQYTHWMPVLPLPKDCGEWCPCVDCQEMKNNWEKPE